MIAECAEVGRDKGIDADVLRRLKDSLWDIHGGDVHLSKAGSKADGYGVLIAYRMPSRQWPYRDGPYRAGDEEWVERFGIEVGRYYQGRAERAA